MKLDDDAALLLAFMKSIAGGTSVTENRQRQVRVTAHARFQGPEVRYIADSLISPGGPRVRCYRESTGRKLPALVWLHGGGHTSGGLESNDGFCRLVAKELDCAVLNVEYRLAPEHKFPAAFDDTCSVLKDIAARSAVWDIDPDYVAVGGASAGANLAAAACLELRGVPNPRIVQQVLVYPVLDMTHGLPSRTANFAQGGILTTEKLLWLRGQYIPAGVDPLLPSLSPLFAGDLSGLPPAFVLTAEYDPLRDDGEVYARKLIEAGCSVRLRRYTGVLHGFFSHGGVIAKGRKAMEDVIESLREVFRR